MKTKTILLAIGIVMLLNAKTTLRLTYAQAPANQNPPANQQTKTDDSGSPDSLFHKFNYTTSDGKTDQNTTANTKIGIIQKLPDGSVLDFITAAIKFMLTLSTTLTVVSFTYGGVILVVNQGNEDEVGKAKKLIYWNLIALGIIAAAYGLTLGVARLTFFQ